MSLFVMLTALYSIYAGARSNISVCRASDLAPAQAMMGSVFGCMAVFIGVLLILCARDLQNRGSIVMWEGVLRLVAGSIMMYFTTRDTSGTMSRSRPLFDLIVGLVYVVALPIALERSPLYLLLDRLR
ncbi:hypothetical protein [Rhizobium mesosinicum]|uniref:DUF4345 domain-containing protein n=1 Tax=Rhizobium mesosinicum TaxID=335017 RepID=A0ABS7GZV0_9HYPH|nr:hypothetical protein [Rhizobium mesosinicum]MBW9054639.1 hypothetical protein [Rhizobium mesosinicum]